jgi:hypothetical protein
MAKLLEGMIGSGLDANGERILLGVARTRQGRLSDGLHHFARVTRQELLASEEPVFFNEYAFALYRAGQVTDAADLLRGAPLDRFPGMQRRWANEFIESHGHIKPPPLEGLKLPRVLH